MAFLSSFDCIGLEIAIPRDCDVDGFLFGETVPRLLVAFDPAESTEVERLANQAGVRFTAIGSVTDGGKLLVRQGGAKAIERDLTQLRSQWNERWRKFF